VYPLVERGRFIPIETTVSAAVRALPHPIGVDSSTGTPEIVTAKRQVAGGTAATLVKIQTGTGFTSFPGAHPDLAEATNVLFPLVVPTGSADKGDEGLPAWGRYFKRRKPGPTPATLLDHVIDSSVIPGLFDADGAIWSTFPKVRP
jgi:hypothetical protein